jgi:excisionase family DNA binding protein
MPAMPNVNLVTTQEAADMLGCSVSHVNQLAREGKLQAAKQLPHAAGRGPRLFDRRSVERYATRRNPS